MVAETPRAPLSVYMLADHLDAALAAGEDLVARGHAWRALVETPGNIQTFPARQREILNDLRAYELIVIARLLKARDHARALAAADKRFGLVANLFASGTAILLDAVEECGDATVDDFETGDGVTAYARSRAMIAADAVSHSGPAPIAVDDAFMIAKRIPLGVLMDLSSGFLDALEVHYQLFSGEDDDLATKSPRPGATEAQSHDFADGEDPSAEAAGAAKDTPPDVQASSGLELKLPPSPLSKLYSGKLARREFGQRQRSSLN